MNEIRANALKMQKPLITVADPADYGESAPNPPYRNFNAFAL